MSDDDFPDDDLPSDDPGSEEEDEFTLEELDAMPQTSSNDDDFVLPGVSVDVFENTLDELRSKFSGSKGRKQATERLLRDFAVVKHSNTVDLGYEAGPVADDLYHWTVRLFNFEGEMAADLARYASATGRPPHVELEIIFPEDYPIDPPFVRVVRPRFQFHRGHVTIGGSICMELLTRSGWSPCNDIDTVLVQIRSEMIAGNARLDHAQMTRDYTMQEAKEAFNRVARQHGWQ